MLSVGKLLVCLHSVNLLEKQYCVRTCVLYSKHISSSVYTDSNNKRYILFSRYLLFDLNNILFTVTLTYYDAYIHTYNISRKRWADIMSSPFFSLKSVNLAARIHCMYVYEDSNQPSSIAGYVSMAVFRGICAYLYMRHLCICDTYRSSCACPHLILYLLVSSADYFCKQFGPRSGPTKRRAWVLSGLIWSQTVWHSDGIHEIIFRKSWFWKQNQQTTKKHETFSRGAKA